MGWEGGRKDGKGKGGTSSSTARAEKFNHNFNHENRYSGIGYIEIAVFVPCRFQSRLQSRFSAQWNSPSRQPSCGQ